MQLIIETPDTRAPERDYILRVILGDFLSLDWQRVPSDRKDACITLQDHSGEIRMPDILLETPDQDWLTPQSLPAQPLPVWDSNELGLPITLVNQYLPVIYGDPHPGRWTQGSGLESESSTINHSQLTHHIPIDLFGSCFFMLTRYEEVVKPDRDEHDRFPAWASLAFQENFLERPIIDEYTEVLWAALKNLWPGLERKEHTFRVIPTHDVDRPFGVKGEPWTRVVRRFGGDVLGRKSLKTVARRAGAVLLPGEAGEKLDPNNTFDWIMEQSERNNLQSEFYFMAGKTSNYDSGYDVFAARIQRLLKRIHDRGHIIGLHPSYGTLGRPDLLASEAENLCRAMEAAGVDQELRSGRQHYLRWHANSTWEDWEQAGLKQDSSVGFAQHVGFRAGTCRSYTTWSWKDSRHLRLVERPLIAMEGSLFSEKYMAVPSSTVAEKNKQLSDTIKTFSGIFIILWHNSRVMDLKDSYELIIFRIS